MVSSQVLTRTAAGAAYRGPGLAGPTLNNKGGSTPQRRFMWADSCLVTVEGRSERRAHRDWQACEVLLFRMLASSFS